MTVPYEEVEFQRTCLSLANKEINKLLNETANPRVRQRLKATLMFLSNLNPEALAQMYVEGRNRGTEDNSGD